MRLPVKIASIITVSVTFCPVFHAPQVFADPPAVASDTKTVEYQVKVAAMIDRATEFLKTQQQPDGGWAKADEHPAITALALRGLLSNDAFNSKTDFVAKGFARLISFQQPDGGIYKDTRANYGTAIALSALAAAKDPAFQPNIEKSIAFLRTLQWTDLPSDAKERVQVAATDPRYGGWGYGSGKRPDGSNTQMTLDALVEAGVKPDDPAIQAAVRFFTKIQNSTESNDQPWATNDGGFIYSLHNNGESFAGEYTDASGTRRLRSYGSMTYAAVKSFVYAGLSKDDPRVKAAFNWIAKNYTLEVHPGMADQGEEMKQWSLYYYYMTFGRALGVYNQPIIIDAKGVQHDWRVELIDKLASLQKPDGSFVGVKKWMEENPVLTTSYILPALQEAKKDLVEFPVK